MSLILSALKSLLRRNLPQSRHVLPGRHEGHHGPVPEPFPGTEADANLAAVAGDQLLDNPLTAYFMRNERRMIHKWVGYFEIYHRAFARFRGKPIKFIEIGVESGGSVQMWRDYFGPQATIIGVDIDPRCKALEEDGLEIWIGDQADPAFWQRLCDKHPQIDVVLDDGGHTMAQQIATFEALFKVLNDGGVYMCEDTHTSYIPNFMGGLKRQGTFHEYAKNLIDEMHAWYFAPLSELNEAAYIARNLYAISFFDSIVAFEKRRKDPPVSLLRGGAALTDKMPKQLSFVDLRRMHGVPDEGDESD